jgi:hypothetical protein
LPVKQRFKVVAGDGIEQLKPSKSMHHQRFTDMFWAFVTSVNVQKRAEVLAKSLTLFEAKMLLV